GLAEYEAKSANEQKRLEQFDEEARFLGEPVELPPLPPEPGSTTQAKPAAGGLFLRLPKGKATKHNSQLLGELLYTYARVAVPYIPPSRRPPGSPEATESPFDAVYFGVASGSADWKEFTEKVQQPLQSPERSEITRLTKDAP